MREKEANKTTLIPISNSNSQLSNNNSGGPRTPLLNISSPSKTPSSPSNFQSSTSLRNKPKRLAIISSKPLNSMNLTSAPNRLAHLLALGPLSFETLLQKIRIPQQDLENLLKQYGHKDSSSLDPTASPNGDIYSLADQYYKELRVWDWKLYTPSQRSQVIKDSIAVFDRLGLPADHVARRCLIDPKIRQAQKEAAEAAREAQYQAENEEKLLEKKAEEKAAMEHMAQLAAKNKATRIASGGSNVNGIIPVTNNTSSNSTNGSNASNNGPKPINIKKVTKSSAPKIPEKPSLPAIPTESTVIANKKHSPSTSPALNDTPAPRNRSSSTSSENSLVSLPSVKKPLKSTTTVKTSKKRTLSSQDSDYYSSGSESIKVKRQALDQNENLPTSGEKDAAILVSQFKRLYSKYAKLYNQLNTSLPKSSSLGPNKTFSSQVFKSKHMDSATLKKQTQNLQLLLSMHKQLESLKSELWSLPPPKTYTNSNTSNPTSHNKPSSIRSNKIDITKLNVPSANNAKTQNSSNNSTATAAKSVSVSSTKPVIRKRIPKKTTTNNNNSNNTKTSSSSPSTSPLSPLPRASNSTSSSAKSRSSLPSTLPTLPNSTSPALSTASKRSPSINGRPNYVAKQSSSSSSLPTSSATRRNTSSSPISSKSRSYSTTMKVNSRINK